MDDVQTTIQSSRQSHNNVKLLVARAIRGAERPILALAVLVVIAIFGIMAVGPAYWFFSGYEFSIYAFIAIAGMTIGLLGVLLPYLGAFAVFLILYLAALSRVETRAASSATFQ